MHKIDISYVLLVPLAFCFVTTHWHAEWDLWPTKATVERKKIGEGRSSKQHRPFFLCAFFCDKFVSGEPANFWELSLSIC
jgi:hypothetical protein